MSRGFTLIELLIVTAIMLILAAVVFSNYAGIREKKILDVEADKVVSIIREVMERSRSQAEGNQWGVHFENPVGEGADFYEIWNGASYPGSGTTTRYYLANYLGFQTPAEGVSTNITFSKGTGLPTATSTIVIELKSGNGDETININQFGSIARVSDSAPPSPPPPPSAPTVTTSAAINVATSTATLNGSGNPNNTATTGWFRYSPTNPGICNDAFGTRAPASGGVSLGGGATAIPYSQDVSNLTPATTYYYCAIAQNSGGTGTGTIVSFITSALQPPPSGGVQSVLPKFETGPAHHSGDNADDSAVWIHPTDPSLSTVIGDDKSGGMMVWNLDGTEIQYIDGTRRLNNVDIRYNFPLQGTFSDGAAHTSVALVGVGYENGNSLAFYKVNPGTRKLENAGEQVLSTSAPYGGCMYHSPASGKYYYFVNWKSGVWQQVELSDAGAGNIQGTVVRTHDAGTQTEGCVTDDVHKLYYIGEENIGVWKYGAEPDDGTSRVQVDKTASGGNLTADVEGMSIYYNSDGTGYLLVSSQGTSTVAVYTRDASKTSINTYLGAFKVAANGGIDETTKSDGLDVTNFPLGSPFPQGLFVIHDASNSGGAASNHKLVLWENVAAALNLLIDTTWDPRQVGL